MSEQVQQILQKISFLEKDMELHKNILATMQESRTAEIEEVIGNIVELKERIAGLKESIKEVDPEMYSQITKMEQASAKFRKLAEEKPFQNVVTLDHAGECLLSLKGGEQLECLVKAQDADGNWTVLTIDGETLEYPASSVED